MAPYGRRYHYSPHDGSLHFGILNVMIALAVVMCLWNVWTVTPANGESNVSTSRAAIQDYTSISTASSSSSSPKQQQLLEQNEKHQELMMQQQLSSKTATTTPTEPLLKMLILSGDPSREKIQNGIQLYPVHTSSNGQKFILLAPEQTHSESRTMTTEQVNVAGEFRDGSKIPTAHSTEMKKQVRSKRRGLSAPLFVDVVTYEPLSSSSGSSSTYAHHHYRPNWYSWMYGIAISGSVFAGGLFAKLALIRMDMWEQLSKEDSLAFDVAYTSPYHDEVESYGSFATSDWSGDYLDRFDI
ncbi:hypothetical protein IV203_030851 [Nitzschia inconspicua]|uniref:Transmembrane protein n=1 Tax=Nitzschia inconspicua TaxID=303405 RepID=A0A9K3LT91_9STRA|nr:hypothetical protein IV203_030851 [Nitzschia inconspicua]